MINKAIALAAKISNVEISDLELYWDSVFRYEQGMTDRIPSKTAKKYAYLVSKCLEVVK